MPEGDTIHRAARALHAALAGQRVERFESVFAHLTRVDADQPIADRLVQRVEARGKHILMWLDDKQGGASLVLRTHMRMHGSWHIYQPGERWQRPRHELRILLETQPYVAVACAVPVAEFVKLGPDLLSDTFDANEACARLAARPDMDVADALLDQRALAGIGNVFKSEVLFAARVSPFTQVGALSANQLARIVTIAARQMRANVGDTAASGRNTTNRLDPSARLWVYGRRGLPCRRCGAPIQRTRQGPDTRATYWCERCQPRLA
jgi:endonuclease-8